MPEINLSCEEFLVMSMGWVEEMLSLVLVKLSWMMPKRISISMSEVEVGVEDRMEWSDGVKS